MSIKVRTFSIVAGSMACDAFCDYCCAPMTGANGIGTREPAVNWRNFRKATQLAIAGGCTTAMITSKGEPTLFPDQISQFLDQIDYRFPIIELQTNGLKIAEGKRVTEDHLKTWYRQGLTTICVSIVGIDPEKNRRIYTKHRPYIDLQALIEKLHNPERPFTVRLTVTMARGFCDSPEGVHEVLDFARKHKVEQVTIRPVSSPERITDSGDAKLLDEATRIYKWTQEHAMSPEIMEAILADIRAKGTMVYKLEHGAEIYDVDGQNLTITNCLKIQTNNEELRSIIFFPDGHVRYLWDKPGAIIF